MILNIDWDLYISANRKLGERVKVDSINVLSCRAA